MSTLSLRKIKHDSSAVDNITLDSSGRVCVGSQDLTAFGRKFLVDGTGGFNNSTGTVGVGFSRGAASTYGYIGTGDWAVNGLSTVDFGISSGATGALVLGTGAGVERVRIDNNGRVTMPYQPSFDVYKGSSAANNNSIIIYDNVRHNIGGHYNTSTGRFTAPVAGRYLFCVINNMGVANQADTLIQVNGSNVTGVEFDPATGGTAYWLGLSIPVILNLNASDYVTVYVSGTPTYGVEGNPWNRFSGQLLG